MANIRLARSIAEEILLDPRKSQQKKNAKKKQKQVKRK